MLSINERFVSIDEDVDVQKQSHNDTFRLWITGSKPEIDFMAQNFIWANKGDNSWFNSKYNQNAPALNGKAFFQFPPNPIKEGDSWKFFFWRTKTPEFIEAQLRSIQLFIRDVNIALTKAHGGSGDIEATANPKIDAFLTKIEQVRDFIEGTVVPSIELPQTRENIEAQLGKFVDELADAVSDADLISKVNDYLQFASIFRYSFINTFLIYIQNRNAKEVLSKGDWKKLNMEPKDPQTLLGKYPGVGAIGLWVPSTVGGGDKAVINAEQKWREENRKPPLPEDATKDDLWYLKPIQKTGLNYTEKVRLDKFVRINSSRMSGYHNFKMRFNHLDVDDVQQIADAPVATKPSQPEWHTSEPDKIADHIYEILVRVIKTLNLHFKEKGDMGGSKGSSSMSGNITLLASNVGIGRASTAAHELAHSLTHQTYLTDQIKKEVSRKMAIISDKESRGLKVDPSDRLTAKETIIRDAYVGRNDTQILELQAEGSAFVVLRYFGIPVEKLKHSAAYISLWRNDDAAVKANLEIISTTAKGIIALMNEEMGNVSDTNVEVDDIEEGEDLSFLYEMSIIRLNRIINEMKELKKSITENVEPQYRTVKDIIRFLNSNGLEVSKKENFYNGSNYGEKYSIVGCKEVAGKTSYLGIPTMVKSQGFITRNGILQNFFCHNGSGFDTTTDINEFLNWVSNK